MSGEGVIPSRIEILPRVQRDADGLLWSPVRLTLDQQLERQAGIAWEKGLLIQEFPLPEPPPHCIHCDVQLTDERWHFLRQHRPNKPPTCRSLCAFSTRSPAPDAPIVRPDDKWMV